MKLLKIKECEQGEGFHCQLCDKSFFHASQEDPVCPNCGASGFKWLEPLTLLAEDGDDEKESGTLTAALDSSIERDSGA